jgi:hypothetical protein
MADRLVPLLATHLARVRFPVPARPAFRVEKWLFSKVSHILRPGNTAFKEQLKLVNGFER